MKLKCGIVGLPSVGKSTVFKAITKSKADVPYTSATPNVGVVAVPDERLERIHEHVETQRVLPADLEVVDVAGLGEGASRGEGLGNKFLGHLKECNALLHVVRCFEDAALGGAPDPIGDIEICEMELAFADLETVDRNLTRVGKRARAGDKEMIEQRDLFEKVKAQLEAGAQVRALDLKPRERELLRPLFLLTAKPVLYVANLREDEANGDSDEYRKLEAFAQERGAEAFAIAAKIECELAELDPEDAAVFLADLGLESTGLERLIRKAFHLLGLRTYFTAGEKEVRAWTFHAGDKAPVAAGVIHSDFEKKFIRAQVYSVEDLEKHGSEQAIKAAGKLRIEGKDYEMQDGDIVNFLIGN
ncbi:MAG: redox-regulated ATPase YchF [Planctomycetes bacterium]|nr:redox-regulated ATPase YchF [Planctomycetota bacterium]MCB9918120.1 redox-regulated ATPase YchF [Planctomycetota bacterium]